MANTLFLRFEGPFQSWGERARWSVRDTSTEPTKSGVVGLLGCALGLRGDDDLMQLSRSLKMGVRCDRQGTFLTDFHTIIGGVLSAEGKIKDETVLSYRSYLCDASFLVALQSSPDQITRLAEAVQHPFWPYYLGRRACVPAIPVYEGVGDFPDLQSALRDWLYRATQKEGKEAKPIRAVIEVEPLQGVQRRDEILSNKQRTFLPRYTREIQIIPSLVREVD
jgi:CRISPR system Cascade subunit CasD